MKQTTKYWPSYGLPGIGLILLAFWAGGAPHPAISLLGFLSFFVVGVTLMKEGRRKIKSRQEENKTTEEKRPLNQD